MIKEGWEVYMRWVWTYEKGRVFGPGVGVEGVEDCVLVC